jgi:L-fuconolactonase
MPVIDSHHHLWRYSLDEYGWIDDGMTLLRRDFLPGDLAAEMKVAGVDGAVAVQARQTLEETQWLLDLASVNPEILGVVGWAPIADDGFAAMVDELAARPDLVGLRHVVQGEPDGFLDGAAFNRGIAALAGTRLVYDILIFERQLAEAIRFVDRHPKQAFVLDHVAKPKIAAGEQEPWRGLMQELARRENVSCKLSGMVTEADWNSWSLDSLRPYLDAVVEAFGPQRLLAGSDWPVCLVASGYKQWWDVLRAYFAGFSESESDLIFGGTAAAVYRL